MPQAPQQQFLASCPLKRTSVQDNYIGTSIRISDISRFTWNKRFY